MVTPCVARSSIATTPGSSIAQSFDHLADRNMTLIRRNADALLADAATSLPYGRREDSIID